MVEQASPQAGRRGCETGSGHRISRMTRPATSITARVFLRRASDESASTGLLRGVVPNSIALIV